MPQINKTMEGWLIFRAAATHQEVISSRKGATVADSTGTVLLFGHFESFSPAAGILKLPLFSL